MKKMVLALVSLLVIGMFLVGCSQESLAGEAVKVQKNVPEISKTTGTMTQCNQLAKDCGFATKEKVIEIIRDEFEVITVNGNYYPEKNCNQACSEKGKECLVALWGYSGSKTDANYDLSIVKASHDCLWKAGDDNILFCECI